MGLRVIGTRPQRLDCIKQIHLSGEQALLGVDLRFGSQGKGLHPCLFFFSGPGLLWKWEIMGQL